MLGEAGAKGGIELCVEHATQWYLSMVNHLVSLVVGETSISYSKSTLVCLVDHEASDSGTTDSQNLSVQ